jgi:hypothetical protein
MSNTGASTPPSRLFDRRGGVDGRLDEPVGLVAVLGREHDLRVALGQRQPGGSDVIVPPPQRVAEAIGIERDAFVEAGHADRDRIDLTQERFSHRRAK